MGECSKQGNLRIAQNSFFLYLRMFFVMFVSLYTSRIVLKSLGEEDFGIQNVVGGFITTLGFIGASISAAISRYFAYEIGSNDKHKLNLYFNHSLFAFLIISLFVVLVGETIGLWFVQTQMTIPPERMVAALWVYHTSICIFIIQLLLTPYNSMIIAQERMSIYAYVSIFDCILKVIVAYTLLVVATDKLILFSILLLATTILSQGVYFVYCRIHFSQETKLIAHWDKNIFKDITSFSGWILFGTLSDVCKGQGLNIILNIFFNPVINAARAISYQINNALSQFVSGFFTACRPQITKFYAQSDIDNMMRLVFQSSRMCYFLFWVISLPVVLRIEYILELWLGKYPYYTAIFSRLVVCVTCIESLSFPLIEALVATGRIKKYQLVTGGLIILTLPVSYLFLLLGNPPETVMYVSIVIAILAQYSRVYFMKEYFNIGYKTYIIEVLFRVFLVSLVSSVISVGLSKLFVSDNFINLLLFSITSVITSLVCVYYIGVKSQERQMINKYIIDLYRSKISKKDENRNSNIS